MNFQERALEAVRQFQAGEITPNSLKEYELFAELAVTTLAKAPSQRLLEMLGQVVPPEQRSSQENMKAPDLPPDIDAGRPGMRKLHDFLHMGAVQGVSEDELVRINVMEQMFSLMRDQTQQELRSYAAAIWGNMRNEWAQGSVVIPQEYVGVPGVRAGHRSFHSMSRFTFDPGFMPSAGATNADQALSGLSFFLDVNAIDQSMQWKGNSEFTDEYQSTESVLAVNDLEPTKAMIQGFCSGIEFALETAYVLLRKYISQFGAEAVTPQLFEAMMREHGEFLHFQQFFSFMSFANLLKILPHKHHSKETLGFLEKLVHPTLFANLKGGKRFHDRFFTTRFADKDNLSVPILDYNFDEFTEQQLRELKSRMLRKGCPALKINAEVIPLVLKMFQNVITPYLSTIPKIDSK